MVDGKRPGGRRTDRERDLEILQDRVDMDGAGPAFDRPLAEFDIHIFGGAPGIADGERKVSGLALRECERPLDASERDPAQDEPGR